MNRSCAWLWGRIGTIGVVSGLLVGMLLLLPVSAGAFTKATVTLDEQFGGVPTRFTFEGVTDPGAPLTGLELTFPEGFDLSNARTDALTLEGLTRVPVTPEVVISGQTVNLTFPTPVAPESTVRVRVFDVLTPDTGGSYAVQAAFTAGGAVQPAPDLIFSYKTTTRADAMARWLDAQGWVTSFTSVKFFDIFLKPQLIVRAVPLLLFGWFLSIALVLIAFPIAIVIGLLWAFAKMSKVAPLRWLAATYIDVIRGTPLFLQIFIVFIGLRTVGVRSSDFSSAVLVLGLNSSAYLAEIFRAGIQSINKGQMEAAVSLGMNYLQAMRFVIIPQTVKRVLPTMTSEFILLFKDTALFSAVGIFELMMRSNNLVARVANLTPYMVAAAFYLVVTIPLIHYVGGLERRLAISEGGQAPGGRRRRGPAGPPVSGLGVE